MLPLMRPPKSRSPPDGEPRLRMRGGHADDERLTDEVHVEARHRLAVDDGGGRGAAGEQEQGQQQPTHRLAHTASVRGFKADNRLHHRPVHSSVMRRTLVAALVMLAACRPPSAARPRGRHGVRAGVRRPRQGRPAVRRRQFRSCAAEQAELVKRFPQLINALDGAGAGVVSHRRRHLRPRHRPGHARPGAVPPGGDGASLQVGGAVGKPDSACRPRTAPEFQPRRRRPLHRLRSDRRHQQRRRWSAPSPTAFACMTTFPDDGCPYFQSLEAAVPRAVQPAGGERGLSCATTRCSSSCFLTDERRLLGAARLAAVRPLARHRRRRLADDRCAARTSASRAAARRRPSTCPRREAVRRLRAAHARPTAASSYDVQRYIDFFTQPDGAKRDPSDVILGSIAPPAAPVCVANDCRLLRASTPCPNLDEACSPRDSWRRCAGGAPRRRRAVARARCATPNYSGAHRQPRAADHRAPAHAGSS